MLDNFQPLVILLIGWLVVLRLNVPVNNFSVMSGRVMLINARTRVHCTCSTCEMGGLFRPSIEKNVCYTPTHPL